jgi:release factor glutamine methyltransferase
MLTVPARAAHNRGVVQTATTWGEALGALEARFRAAGLEEAAVDAALLLGYVVGAARTLVRLERERPLTAEQAARLAVLAERRAAREPLPYVLGEQEFCGHAFVVDVRALIPRWDSEALVDWLAKRLADHPAPIVADLGTGSGALAVSLALDLPKSRVEAVDCSAEALDLARSNAARHGVDGRVTFHLGHLAEPLHAAGLAGRVDAVLANLPYIPSADIASLEPEVRAHEPRLALDGGPDGLDVIRACAPRAAALLAHGGCALFECGDGQAAAVDAILGAAGLDAGGTVNDWGGRPRGVWGVRGDLFAALAALEAGELILFPTETVYGIGARCDRPAAIARLYAAKGRDAGKPLQILVADASTARRLAADWPPMAEALAARFWPGPLTLVVPASEAVPADLRAADGTVGLRCPDLPLLTRLLAAAGPLAASSANRAGQPPATTRAEAVACLGDAAAVALDGGTAREGVASTVVRLGAAGVEILRQGALSAADIEAVRP